MQVGTLLLQVKFNCLFVMTCVQISTHLTSIPIHTSLCSVDVYSTLGGRGNWTTDGCELARINGSVAICHCSHLTNFGVLVVCKITQSPVIICFMHW